MDKQVNKCIFEPSPAKWQQQCIHSGQWVTTTPLSDIAVNFMSNKKSFTDTQDLMQTSDKKNRFNNHKDSRVDSYQKGKASNEKWEHHVQKRAKDSKGLKQKFWVHLPPAFINKWMSSPQNRFGRQGLEWSMVLHPSLWGRVKDEVSRHMSSHQGLS